MGRMKRDMSDIWSVFVVDLEAHLEHVNDEVDEAFDTVLEIALSTGSNESGVANNTGSSMRTLAEALHHRQDITLHGIDRASESFQSELGSLNTNAFSSIRTAFTGKLMETIYHAANMEYGKLTLPSPALSYLLLTPMFRYRQRSPPQRPHHAQIQLLVPLRQSPSELQGKLQGHCTWAAG